MARVQSNRQATCRRIFAAVNRDLNLSAHGQAVDAGLPDCSEFRKKSASIQ
jgi:hypothetical protein